MSTDSKTKARRRQLRFNSLEETVVEAGRLAADPNVKMLGNWPLDRLLSHLTVAVNSSIDGIPGQAPWLVRLLGPLIKGRIFRRGMSPGFRLPKKLEAVAFPADASIDEALAKLKAAVARTTTERMSARHPVFGNLTHEEWVQFHLRHAELHLSFAVT